MKAGDSVFWERLVDMPYGEAIEELVSRRIQLVAERAVAERKRGTPEWDSAADADRNAQLSKINAEIKRIHNLLNTLRWKDAVLAIFGREGYEACALWMAQQDPRSGAW